MLFREYMESLYSQGYLVREDFEPKLPPDIDERYQSSLRGDWASLEEENAVFEN